MILSTRNLITLIFAPLILDSPLKKCLRNLFEELKKSLIKYVNKLLNDFQASKNETKKQLIECLYNNYDAIRSGQRHGCKLKFTFYDCSIA